MTLSLHLPAAFVPTHLPLGVFAPAQVLHAHLPHDQAFALGMGAFLGFLALFGGIENLHQVALGNHEPGPKGTGPRYNIGSGIIGVLAGGFFIWLPLIFILPRVQQQIVADQRAALRSYLSENLATLPVSTFLEYVHAGAVGIDEDLGGGSALEDYLRTHHSDAVSALLAAGASVEAHSNGQPSPLTAAVDNNNLDGVRLLLAAHADPNAPLADPSENLPLFDAVNPNVDADDWQSESDHSRQITAALVAAGAHLDVRDDRSYTPLMIAAATGRCDLVLELLKGHPDVTLQASTGETALTWATSQHTTCAPILNGGTPTQVARALAASSAPGHTPQDTGEETPRSARLPHPDETLEERKADNQHAQDEIDNGRHPGGWIGAKIDNAMGRLFWTGVLAALGFCFHHALQFLRRLFSRAQTVRSKTAA